jgi:5-methylcytosine-specific restriction endonuclease McrA
VLSSTVARGAKPTHAGRKETYRRTLDGGKFSGWKWQRRREEVLKRDGYRCVKCGSAQDVKVHHRVWVSEGGSDDVRNLVTLCKEHHDELHREDFQRAARKAGRG